MTAVCFFNLARTIHITRHYLVMLLSVVFILPVGAIGNFTVAPVRIEVSAAQRSAWFQVTNTGDERAQLTVEAAGWTAGDMRKDAFPITNELAATPPIFELEPGEHQIVRVLLLRPADTARQLSYRLFVQEQPRIDPANSIAVQTVLRMSLPVFVTPPKAKAAVQWSLVQGTDGLALEANNTGNAAALIIRVSNENDELLKDVGGYLMAYETRRWPIIVPAQRLRIEYFGEQEQTMTVLPGK